MPSKLHDFPSILVPSAEFRALDNDVGSEPTHADRRVPKSLDVLVQSLQTGFGSDMILCCIGKGCLFVDLAVGIQWSVTRVFLERSRGVRGTPYEVEGVSALRLLHAHESCKPFTCLRTFILRIWKLRALDRRHLDSPPWVGRCPDRNLELSFHTRCTKREDVMVYEGLDLREGEVHVELRLDLALTFSTWSWQVGHNRPSAVVVKPIRSQSCARDRQALAALHGIDMDRFDERFGRVFHFENLHCCC
mmetsp:Transcript_38537/g.46582  ORF Transcript_38537/g.46582 Transcript_38537/m.46582 type:complete len:248 (-) Transcript_38537:386-1129(-)